MNTTNAIYITQLDTEFYKPDNGNLKDRHFVEILKQNNILPFSKGTIYYQDNLWDFSDFSSLNISKKDLRFNFDLCKNSAFIDDIKNYVLLSLLENKVKIQTIHKNYLLLKSFFLDIEQTHHVYHVKDISLPMIKEYLLNIRESSSVTQLRSVKTCIKSFYMQYSANFGDIASKGLLNLFEQDDYKVFKSYQNDHRTKDIPSDYFNKFEAACIIIMNDETMPVHHRGTACVYVILAETGLRIGEILGLRVGSLHTTKIFSGEEANYLTYSTWKREDGNNTVTTAITYINEKSRKAYDVLMEIYQPRREALKLDYLYMGGKYVRKSSFPYHSEKFKKIAFQFFVELDSKGLLNTVNLPEDEYPTIHRFNTTKNRLARSKRLPNEPVKSVTFPDSQQFRFHCCSVLAQKGCPLEYIKRFMSHLTDEMVRYHILPQSTPQEDMEYSLKVLREVVSGKTKILGDHKGLSEKIQEFIQENHFNVEKDLETICSTLAQNIPIRQKTGGVCIKSSKLRSCSIDAATNEFYCAYGVCPNIYHFYYMADITYRQCKELEETIKLNIERNHIRQAEKERNMLLNIVTKRLLPEIEELKDVVQREGISKIYLEHPELKEIIENLDIIETEICLWKSLKS